MSNYFKEVGYLHQTSSHIGSCIKGVNVETHKYGAKFSKGKRTINLILDNNSTQSYDSKKSETIHKGQHGYYIKVDRRDVKCYYLLKDAVKKALGIKGD